MRKCVLSVWIQTERGYTGWGWGRVHLLDGICQLQEQPGVTLRPVGTVTEQSTQTLPCPLWAVGLAHFLPTAVPAALGGSGL